MVTVNIAITATVKQLEDFANELGYQEFVPNITENGLDGVIPNPQDRRAFLQAYFKRTTVDELSKVRLRAIEQAVLDARENEKEVVRKAIRSAVNVTFTP